MQVNAPVAPAFALRRITDGLRAAQALYVAAELKVADYLAAGPMSGQELAAAAGADAGALHRVMRALCALGVFVESAEGQFSLNDMSQALRSDVPGSFRGGVLFTAGNVRWRCWSDLLGTVRAGGDSAERTLGLSLFDFYAANPRESEIHDQAMRGISAGQLRAILNAMDFSQAGRLVDVGGGTGELLAAILAATPGLRGVLFDLPHVVAHATQVFKDRGVGERADCVGGSFFDTTPPSGDTYILKTVIHDWDDARATAILRNCRKGISAAGKLLLIERELPEPGQANSPEPFMLDLEMLVMTPGGRERTRAEFAALLRTCGFEFLSTTPTASTVSIIEARPV
jgi:hypothetical protein